MEISLWFCGYSLEEDCYVRSLLVEELSDSSFRIDFLGIFIYNVFVFELILFKDFELYLVLNYFVSVVVFN